MVFGFLLIGLAISCRQKQTTTAKIIERKTANDKVLVKYAYSLNNQQYIDSEMVANVIIPHDSIKLQIDGESHKLLIP